MDSFAGYDHQQDALGFEPRIGMAEKQLLHTLIGARSHLEVIGRVEVEEGNPFDPGTHVEDVALNGLDAALFGADCTVGVEFHAIERGVRTTCQSVECGPGATARIERGGGCFGKGKSSPQHGALLNGEGVISQLQTRSNPHFAILSNCGDEMKTGSTSCRFGDSSDLAWGYTI